MNCAKYYNLAGKEQEVEILLEGKEPQVKAFVDLVLNNKPDDAIISDITTSDYDDEVQRRNEYVQDITAMQMLKAIPMILKIEKNTGQIQRTAENTDMIPQMAKTAERTANAADKILEEVKGLREDQPNVAMQLRQLRQDVEAIKSQLKMT